MIGIKPRMSYEEVSAQGRKYRPSRIIRVLNKLGICEVKCGCGSTDLTFLTMGVLLGHYDYSACHECKEVRATYTSDY
jgi:hypothetical protein